jgi:hypothetical protein
VDRAPVQTVTLHRTKATAWDQFHPIHCGSLAEASRAIVRMARQAPPTGKLLSDPVTVTVQWPYHTPFTFTYFLQAFNLRAADLGGALEGALLWEREHGSDRAESILRYCDLGDAQQVAA